MTTSRTTSEPAPAAEPPEPPETRRGRSRASRLRALGRPNFAGLLLAVAGFGAALTPSLLPRPWLFEGVIAGLGAALGYGVGVLVSWLVRKTQVRTPRAEVRRWAWRGLAVVAPLAAVLFLLLGVRWQNDVRTLVGMPDEGLLTAFVVALVALPVAVATVMLCRGLRRAARWIARRVGRFVPAGVAAAIGALAVALIIYTLVTGLLFTGFVSAMDTLYAGTNAGTAPGVTQPLAPERSGSSASTVAWDSLGIQGRSFVGRGPDAATLEQFSGRPAKTPIRVYVGLDSAPTAHERAEAAVRELTRTGAFSRKVLVVAGSTGTGWLEPQATDSLEYEWNGDSAIVTIQYSYLPSWISTLVDVDRAREAGRELFDAVYATWSTLPEATRPKLLAYGLSLGSFSSQSAFTSAADISARTQGAVFVGSPNFSEPWSTVVADRDAGSPEWQPVVDRGTTIRFAGVAGDLEKPAGPWDAPRVAYLQHANDPVVWWSPELLNRRPDWLAEAPGAGRTPEMHWYPVLTFLQVTVDQFVGVSVPDGQGHNYGSTMPAAWADVSQPPDWSDADTARLTSLIAGYAIE
ncbi:membrane protein [Intrasporangium oryzae NRRL B-24470]|uniref:Membrane protein n=1 Tax=Intrasporangium oryzae NRRL B-24470 TaxID=1386089 RepID=W9G7M9_9MICO|nr:alpha/beta-hydrolase family protein [Intrasporangium oryzae]EWT02196.1 membrane protein [Intrasporangium oryzae NRRL B-24470]